MKKALLAVFAAMTIAALSSAAAQAQNNRSFVSGHGSDGNSCTLAAPCRSFAQAYAATNAGGEIVVLDSAGYGTLTISKSITITNPGGVEAGITTTAGQTAITINPSSSIVVTLRGLTLEGGGVGQNGIVLTSTVTGTLNIIDCVVKDFTGFGIAITPSFSGGETTANVLITNSFVLHNAGSGIEIFPQSDSTFIAYAIDHTTVDGNGTSGTDAGILVNSGAGFLSGSIASVQARHNNVGVNFIGNGFVTFTAVRNSVLTNNTSDLINNSSGINLYILDANQINQLFNEQTTRSDGTNDIISLSGALTPFSRQ